MTTKKTTTKSEKAAKKDVATKAPAKKASAGKKASVEKKATPSKKRKSAKAEMLSSKGEEAFMQIQQEAYYIAEKDGFRCDPLEYWCEAEIRLGMRKA